MQRYAYAKNDTNKYCIIAYDRKNDTKKMYTASIECPDKYQDYVIKTIMCSENELLKRKNSLNKMQKDIDSLEANIKIMKTFKKSVIIFIGVLFVIGYALSRTIYSASVISALLTAGQSLLLVGLPVYLSYVAITHFKGMPRNIIKRLEDKLDTMNKDYSKLESSIAKLKTGLKSLKGKVNYQESKKEDINYDLLRQAKINYLSVKENDLPPIVIPKEETISQEEDTVNENVEKQEVIKKTRKVKVKKRSISQ